MSWVDHENGIPPDPIMTICLGEEAEISGKVIVDGWKVRPEERRLHC